MRPPRKWSPRRGQAAVEMAVTMIVLIPIIFYSLFLEDLLVFHLEWQEAIVVSPWEPSFIDYVEKKNPSIMAMRYNRVAYCDHTVANDTFNATTDCDDAKHHVAMTAHQCWLGGGKQVTCGKDTSIGKDIQTDYYDKFNGGGLVHCTARLNVSNWFIINRFRNFGKELVESDRERHQDSEDKHTVGKSTTESTGWVFGGQGESGGASSGGEAGDDGAEEDTPASTGGRNTDDYFSVLHDPWAVNRVDSFSNMAKVSTHKIYERMSMYYKLQIVKDATDKAKDFGQGLVDDEILGDKALKETDEGDDVTNPDMSFSAGDHKRAAIPNAMDYSAAWPDQRQQDTYSGREGDYMGMPKSTW